MSCNASITPLSTSGSGELQALTCCSASPAPEQELARRWKQVRRDVFSTAPIPFGVASFSTGFGTWFTGPPKPGDDATSAAPPLVVDPTVTSASSPANPGPRAYIPTIIPD